MKTDNATSASSTARTSGGDERERASKLQDDLKNDPQNRPNADRPQPLHPESSEADFLTLQQEHAKAAIGRVVGQMKSALAEGANPVEWAKQYPWVTLGASTVAGFVATALLVPSREQQALNKLAAIERALNPQPKQRERESRPNGDDDSAKSYKHGGNSFLTLIAREVIGAIRPALISLLTAGVTAKAAKPSQEEMESAAANEDAKQAEQGMNPDMPG